MSWDEGAKQWTVSVKRTITFGTTKTRTLHPKHVVQCTGHFGKKNYPTIKGMDNFRGDVLCHSSEFKGARQDGKGKKAIIIGACNSGHDILQDF
jgi:cation diffusion facilitator CzcD-associated flavoprotein CzcO